MQTEYSWIVLGLAFATLTGCGGGGDGSGSQPSQSAATITVDVSLNTTTARVGDPVTINWSSQSTTSCVASGDCTGTRATGGSQIVTPAQVGTSTYILTCSGPGGSGSDTASLTTAAALEQLTIPGVPASINYAKGGCVPSEDENFKIVCHAAASSIPAKYDSFSSSLSGRISFTPPTQPAVVLGGSCVGGFERAQSRLTVDSTFFDVALPLTGATVSEIIYKPAFLQALPGAITEMSVLIAADDSNTDRMGMVVHAIAAGEAVTFAIAGTVSNAGGAAVDLVECIAEDEPATPPPPAGLACSEGRGIGRNGLSFSGPISYAIDDTAANEAAFTSVDWGVRYNDADSSANSYTGSLRLTLWAVPASFAGSGDIRGHRIFTGAPNFVGTGARSSTQIYNFYTFSNISSSGFSANPPAGEYCIVAALDQYSSSDCTSSDGYCYSDWVQFGGSTLFR